MSLRRLARLLPIPILASCGGTPSESFDQTTAPVIAGATNPADLDFEVHPLQQLATLAQIAHVAGHDYQGCSGTLIGDGCRHHVARVSGCIPC